MKKPWRLMPSWPMRGAGWSGRGRRWATADSFMYPAAFYTLGCKLNQLESEALADSFRRSGFTLVPWGTPLAGPGLLIINTCTVTSKADQKCRRLIRKALRDNPGSCVIVTGCYARLDPGEIEALEAEATAGAEDGLSGAPVPEAGERRLFAAGAAKSALIDLPAYIREKQRPGLSLPGIVRSWIARAAGNSPFNFKPAEFTFHSRGYLKIQDGCDNCCTYCRVRLARGPSVSLPPESALAELRSAETAGLAELMITGVNISQYRHSGLDLAGLLEYLLDNSSTIALRLASLEPEGITARLAAVLARPRIRPHFHLSVQSGSDTVLRRMNRRYRAQTVGEGAALLRSAKENPFLACDIIAGFPGETEAEFAETIALCEKINFAWIHAFPFSKRPGTPAFTFANPVNDTEISRRVKALTDLALRGRRRYAQSWLGRELSAVVEKGKSGKDSPPGFQCRALSENYLKLAVNVPEGLFPAGPQPGSVLRCVPVSLCEGGDGEKPDAAAEAVR